MTNREKPSTRIKEIMDEKGLKQVDVINRSKPFQEKYNIKLSKSHMSQYVNGISNPDQEKYFLLSKVLGVTEPWLMGYDVAKYCDDNDINSIYSKLEDNRKKRVYAFAVDQLEDQNNQVQESSVIYITSKLSAGTGIVDLDPDYQEERDYHGYVPKHDLAFIVDGDSMQPVFESGEVVFVEKTHEVRNGQIIAVQINEEAYIKKAYVEEDQLRLVSLNTKYDDIIANGGDDIRVVGRVVL